MLKTKDSKQTNFPNKNNKEVLVTPQEFWKTFCQKQKK